MANHPLDALDPAASLYMADIDLCFMCPELVDATDASPLWNTNWHELANRALDLQGRPRMADGSTSKKTLCQPMNVYSYIGGQGTGTGLHQDNIGTNFWMTVLSGTKEMVLYPPSDIAYLVSDPAVLRGCDSDGYCRDVLKASSTGGLADFFLPNMTSHTNLRRALAHVVELRPGDVLYASGLW